MRSRAPAETGPWGMTAACGSPPAMWTRPPSGVTAFSRSALAGSTARRKLCSRRFDPALLLAREFQADSQCGHVDALHNRVDSGGVLGDQGQHRLEGLGSLRLLVSEFGEDRRHHLRELRLLLGDLLDDRRDETSFAFDHLLHWLQSLGRLPRDVLREARLIHDAVQFAQLQHVHLAGLRVHVTDQWGRLSGVA